MIGKRVEQYDAEEMMYRDVLKQLINEKRTTAYVYNENIINKLKENIPDLNIEKKDFYWEIKRRNVNKKLLTIKKICEEFDITRHILDNWIKLGCPIHIIAGRKYFIAEEVEEWIKSK